MIVTCYDARLLDVSLDVKDMAMPPGSVLEGEWTYQSSVAGSVAQERKVFIYFLKELRDSPLAPGVGVDLKGTKGRRGTLAGAEEAHGYLSPRTHKVLMQRGNVEITDMGKNANKIVISDVSGNSPGVRHWAGSAQEDNSRILCPNHVGIYNGRMQ